MNGKVLAWGRVQMGIEVDELAGLMKQDTATVMAWEAGTEHPTLRQLEAIAGHLKLPLAVFFFSVVPKVPPPRKEFRMLPEAEGAGAARDTSYAIREAQARQMSILEITHGENPAGENFLLFAAKGADAKEIRALLGVSLEQQESWPNAEEAFKAWRDALEKAGIFVFKRAFVQMEVSGFCLPHPRAPIIVVNNKTTWPRQVFTLFHELGHILHQHHGVTRADAEYMDSLRTDDKAVEIKCNRFASHFLLPPAAFKPYAEGFKGSEGEVQRLAGKYNVSHEVVLRRLLDLGKVDADTYREWTTRWNSDFYKRAAPEGGGGSYYATQAAYLGPAFLRLTFSAYLRGELNTADLADHLGVKAKNIAGLEPYLKVEGASG